MINNTEMARAGRATLYVVCTILSVVGIILSLLGRWRCNFFMQGVGLGVTISALIVSFANWRVTRYLG